jgi:DNA-binding NtrC family response regulator/tetratricopeptide (TPR) repeat protein
MPLIADRFLVHEEPREVVDLATGEVVRLVVEHAPAGVAARVAVCDRLAALRHPLLLPLVDYGMCGDRWFEAHAWLPALRAPALQARQTALHLVRFLRAAGVELPARAVERNVRPAIDGRSGGWRPVGVFLQPRPVLETVRTVIESTGPPGVTSIVMSAPCGAGLRTARLQIARAARLAGYHVIDSRLGGLDAAFRPRHVCVLDWLPPSTALPPLLSLTAAAGARRHLWIRFCREPVSGPGSIGLEPLMTREMTAAIYIDSDYGPSAAEVKYALPSAAGLPGMLIEALSVTRRWRAGTMWVHETSPEYVVRSPAASPALVAPAGVARLERAVEAARALARRGRHARAIRVLSRGATALATRGATAAAAGAACTLGEILLDRGQPARAAHAFEDAASWSPCGAFAVQALLGRGRALMEQGRLEDAEAAFRTARLSEDAPGAAIARSCLADVLCLRGRLDAAEEAAGTHASASLSTIRRLKGDLQGAAHAAARALAESGDPRALCAAHLAAAHVHAALGHVDEVRRHGRDAQVAACRARIPALRLQAAAESHACLQQCGVAGGAARERLVRAARGLPPLAAARVRVPLGAATEEDMALIAPPRDNSDLIHRFQMILGAIHDAPDESAALTVIAADLLTALDACSLVIRSAALCRLVAIAGRPWPDESAFVQTVLDGGGPLFRRALTAEACEPIRTGGAVIGSIAARWVPGAEPPVARLRDLLRVAAAAAAPLLKSLAALALAPPDRDGLSYPDDLLGCGPAAERVREAIRRAAAAPYPVLIEGESGSGKELVARAIHARGPRRARRFCAVNCAALADDLLEAELFGHVRGAFTGAVVERPGLFEEADQGTILLDEAGELTPRAQAKLLRVLQEGEVRRIGENLPRKVDARVVAATNRSLEDDVRSGRFRADLRFRLDVIRIRVPPLRERADEIPWLAGRIWTEAASRVGTRATLGDDAVAALARYDWPGNVRELQNVIASVAVHGPRRGRVPASLLPAHIAGGALQSSGGLGEAREDFERRYVRAALARARGSRTAAAAQLGVSRQGFTKMLKRLGIAEA